MGARVVIGLSSWSDAGFVADWYPPGMPARERLAWYAERFEAVELNSSFYALPDRLAVQRWVEVTPKRFTFDIKLHRLHSRHAAPLESLPPDLRAGVAVVGRGRVALTAELEQAMLERLREELDPLERAGKLHGFLLQLSPAFAPERHELSELEPVVSGLAPYPVAVELRHRAWVEDRRREQTLDALTGLGAGFVCVDAPDGDQVTIMPALDAVTHPKLAYLRLHGRNLEGYVQGQSVAERFGWVYSDEELGEVSRRVSRLAEDAQEVRVMFNNNRSNDAPVAARRMREIFGQDPGPEPLRELAAARGGGGRSGRGRGSRPPAGQGRLL